MKKIVVSGNDAGQRTDKFILKMFPALPKSYLYKTFRKKDIKVNGKRVEGNYFLEENDVLEIYIKDDLLIKKEVSLSVPEIFLDELIIYEDDNIILINKPAEISVHGNEKEKGGLVDSLLYYLNEKGEFNPQEENYFTPAFCNRLDKNTGGIIIAGKNAETLRIINEMIKNRELEKSYLCCVDGEFNLNNGIEKAYLFKDEKNRKALISHTPKDGYKEIVTEFKLIEKKDNLSLVEATLHTGRFHQIRAHLSSLGYPLLNDKKYGGKSYKQYPFHCLYSYKLKFYSKNENLLSYLNGKEFTVKVPF